MSMRVGHTRAACAANDARVVEMTLRGYTAREIAQELGVTMRTVVRSRGRAGVAAKPRSQMTDDELAIAEAMLDDGCSFMEVARTLGRASSAVAAHFPGRGWTRAQAAEHSALCQRSRGVL